MITGVPAGARRTAYAAFIREIMTAPALANRRVIKTWLLFDGKAPPSDPTIDAMPAARLRVLGGEVVRVASRGTTGTVGSIVTQSTPTLLIELWTRGQDQNDIHDLHDMIEDALFPTDQAARQALVSRLAAVGVADWQFTRDIAPTELGSFGEAHVAGSGEIQLTLSLSN